MIDGSILADRIGGRLEGESRRITNLAMPGSTDPRALVVAADADALTRTLAPDGAAKLAAVIVDLDAEIPANAPPIIRHADPRYALALVSRELDDEPVPAAGVAPTAQVDESATLAEGVHVGPGAVVAAGVVLAEGVSIGPGTVVGEACSIGPDSRLFARVTLYPRVRLGANVRVHAGAVLGVDGFGYAPGPQGAAKIHHLGGVVVGDDVEIGANTSVDRGTLGDTVIGAGSKIGNQCLIAHNVQVGRHCLIVGHVAVGGSTVIEDGVQIGGAASFADHVRVGAGARIAGRAAVTKNVPPGEQWVGYPAVRVEEFVRTRYLTARLERIWAYVRAQRSGEDEGRR